MEPDVSDLEHRELQTLLGAFALDATSELERRRVERHLQSCVDCAREVRLLRDAASELAWLPDFQDADDLVTRMAESLPKRPRRVLTWVSVGVAAGSLAAAGFLGTGLVRERVRNTAVQSVLAEATRRVQLDSQRGFAGHGVLHFAGDKAVLVLEDLPDLGRDRSYQLWAIEGTTPRSATVLEATGRVVHLFAWSGKADRFALTIEPSSGSPAPTTDPVLAGA